MHEFSLITDLIAKVESIATQQSTQRILCIRVKVGAQSCISPEILRNHFLHSARGTVAESANLEIEVVHDEAEGRSNMIVLDSLEVAD